MNNTTPPQEPSANAKDPVAAPAKTKHRKWLTLSALTLAALILLSVILLPVGIQYGLRNWLLENGANNVHITDVDLNPFTGTLLIEGIRINVDERNTLRADTLGLNFAWQALLKKRFTLTSVQLGGIDIEIIQGDDGKLRIGGILLPQANAETANDLDKLEGDIKQSSPWGVGIDELNFADINIRYRMPKLEVDTHVEKLSLRQLASWRPGKGAQVTLQASINGAPLKYDGSMALFAAAPHVDGTLDLQNLALDNFQQIAAIADELRGKLSLQTTFDVSLAGTAVDVKLKAGDIRLHDLLFATADIRLQQKSLSWTGDIGVQQADKLHFTAVGSLTSQQLATRLAAQKLDITQKNLKAAVNMAFTSGDENSQPDIAALLDDTEISQLYVSVDKFPLAGLEKLAVNKLKLRDPGTLTIQQIQLEKLYVARSSTEKTKASAGSPAMLSNSRLTIEDLLLKNANNLSIKNILLNDADVFVSNAPDGSSNVSELLAAIEAIGTKKETAPAGKAADDKQQKTDSEPAIIHIGHIQIAGDSTVVIEDASTTPMTRIDISIEDLSLDNIDNSSPAEVTTLQTKGKFGRFGSYTISAETQLFSEKVNGKLVSDLQGVDLPRLSPYTARALDFRLRSGTLDSDMNISIVEDQLSGKTQLVLHQLELIPIENKKQQGDMTAASLNSSLNMLRDKNNTITLNIPLSGDINAPDFSIQNVLNQALMSGVKTGVMTYALLALQPYGTMVVVAKYAGEQMSKLRLDPVKFLPGSSEIDATGKDYLSKVAGIITDRPKVDIKVCGVAVSSDTAALAAAAKDKAPASEKETLKKLKTLAKQRSIAVREYLISLSKKDGHQLIGCMPSVEQNDADALPRVDLLI